MKKFKYLLNILSIYTIINSYNPAIAENTIGSGTGNLSFTIDSICYFDADTTPINMGTVKYTGGGKAIVNPDGTTQVSGGVTEIVGSNPGIITILCTDNASREIYFDRSSISGTGYSLFLIGTDKETATSDQKIQAYANTGGRQYIELENGRASINIGGYIFINSSNVAGSYKGYVSVCMYF